MKIHYLEIVTPDVDAAVALHSKIRGISFGVPDENLGGARAAKLATDGTVGADDIQLYEPAHKLAYNLLNTRTVA